MSPRAYVGNENQHKDTGCSYTNSCLKCDLILCRYEEGYSLASVIALTKNVVVEQRRREELARESVIEEAKEIMLEVAEKYGVTVYQLTSSSRTKHVVKPRWEVMRRLRDELDLTLDAIGRVVHRDHSTVLYGLSKVSA